MVYVPTMPSNQAMSRITASVINISFSLQHSTFGVITDALMPTLKCKSAASSRGHAVGWCTRLRAAQASALAPVPGSDRAHLNQLLISARAQRKRSPFVHELV